MISSFGALAANKQRNAKQEPERRVELLDDDYYSQSATTIGQIVILGEYLRLTCILDILIKAVLDHRLAS